MSAPIDDLPMPDKRAIAEALLGSVTWATDDQGLLACPGRDLHHNRSTPRDCKVFLSGAPSIACFHTSCSAVIERLNFELRSRIGKAKAAKSAHPTGKRTVRTVVGKWKDPEFLQKRTVRTVNLKPVTHTRAQAPARTESQGEVDRKPSAPSSPLPDKPKTKAAHPENQEGTQWHTIWNNRGDL